MILLTIPDQFDAVKSTFVKSRKGWMEAARVYASLWPTRTSREQMKECIAKAKSASRNSWQFFQGPR